MSESTGGNRAIIAHISATLPMEYRMSFASQLTTRRTGEEVLSSSPAVVPVLTLPIYGSKEESIGRIYDDIVPVATVRAGVTGQRH
jgi:hypothetical protein